MSCQDHSHISLSVLFIHSRRSATSYFYMLSEVLLDTLIAYLFACYVMSVAIFYGMSCCILRCNLAQDTLSAWQRVRTHCIHPAENNSRALRASWANWVDCVQYRSLVSKLLCDQLCVRRVQRVWGVTGATTSPTQTQIDIYIYIYIYILIV